MYFLAILLGISRADDCAELLVFLNTLVLQDYPLVYASTFKFSKFLTALYATSLLVGPLACMYDRMGRNLAGQFGDWRQRLRDWVQLDPEGVFFNNTHCAPRLTFWANFWHPARGQVRPRVVERLPVLLCPEFLNPSGKSRE